MSDEDETIRGWAIQCALEDKPSAAILEKLVAMAKEDDSTFVRLYCQRPAATAADQRWDLATALVSHEADKDDHNLPLMYWYGIEPLCPRTRSALCNWPPRPRSCSSANTSPAAVPPSNHETIPAHPHPRIQRPSRLETMALVQRRRSYGRQSSHALERGSQR